MRRSRAESRWSCDRTMLARMAGINLVLGFAKHEQKCIRAGERIGICSTEAIGTHGLRQSHQEERRNGLRNRWIRTGLSMRIETEAELEEFLSRPTDADVAAIAQLDGDLLILGAGGKMGPSLARRARRVVEKAGVAKRIVAVARFSDHRLRDSLESHGIETLATDLLQPGALSQLPDIPNVIFMAARKFGTTGSEDLTWAMNTYLPGLVADRYRASRIVAFSTGNVYPLRDAGQGGAVESTPVAPESEYAQSALGRERMFEYGSRQWGTPVVILRLNYAIDLRYGVLLDIGTAVFERRPIGLGIAFVNVIWQGDANSVCLRSFEHC